MTKEKDTKDKTGINKLPEYKIQTMKDDLAKAGPAKPDSIPAPPDKLPIVETPFTKAPEVKRAPLPSAEELISKKKLAKPPKPTPKLAPKPKKEKKPFWTPKKQRFLIITIIIIIILTAIGVFFYWQGTKVEPPPEPQPQPQIPEPSASLIPVDEIKIFSLTAETSLFNLLEQEAETSQLIDTFKRIAILSPSADGETEFLSLAELFQELEITAPPYALAEIGPDYTLVLYSQNEGRRVGLITQIKNSENLKTQLTVWEQTMLNNFKNFYIDDQPGQKETETFQDDVYKETAIRYINLPTPVLTINYAIVNDLLVIGTSKQIIYTIIDKILP